MYCSKIVQPPSFCLRWIADNKYFDVGFQDLIVFIGLGFFILDVKFRDTRVNKSILSLHEQNFLAVVTIFRKFLYFGYIRFLLTKSFVSRALLFSYQGRAG